jgi:hypothetical protein
MRYMTRFGCAIVLIGMTLAACGGTPVTPSDAVGRLVTPGADLNGALTCPGDQWPPFGAPTTMAGIDVRSSDREHVEVRNGTLVRYHVRIAAWDAVQLEECRGLVDFLAAEGPLEPGQSLRAELHGLPELEMPIAVSIYEGPCGEGECTGPPLAVLLVERSDLEPVATD